MSPEQTSAPPAVTEKRIAGRLIHPAALLIPELDDAARLELRNSIAEHGFRPEHAVVIMPDGSILDGRHRAQEARMCGREPVYRTFTGDDPYAYVIDANLRRRQLTPSQRAMVAAELLPHYEAERADRKRRDAEAREAAKKTSSGKIARTGPKTGTDPEPTSREQVAQLAGVSDRSVADAKIVREHGAPELVEAVRADKLAVSTAADLADLPLAEQLAALQLDERGAIALAKRVRAEKQANNRTERVERIKTIAQGNRPLEAGPERYAVIMADPPWEYDAPISESREIENHYPTMPLSEILAMDVGSKLATPDALLLLWATAPLLPEALAVAAAWGFEYRTHQVWAKTGRTGMGRWLRVEHEILIWAVRGKIPVPPPELRPPSVLEAPTSEHSAKPAIFAEHVERAYAGLPMIELFCREPRAGWAAWGKQADGEGTKEAEAPSEGGAEADRGGAGSAPVDAGVSVARARRSPRRARPDVATPGPGAA